VALTLSVLARVSRWKGKSRKKFAGPAIVLPLLLLLLLLLLPVGAAQHSRRLFRTLFALRLRQSSAAIVQLDFQKPALLQSGATSSLTRSPALSGLFCVSVWRGLSLSASLFRSLGHFSHQFMTAKQTICAKQNSIIKAFVVLVPSGLASWKGAEGGEGRGTKTVGETQYFGGIGK